ncbi:UNVERIFIED_CONTAM: hypothetical protein FKN15_067488 [Acipenser sinensis]
MKRKEESLNCASDAAEYRFPKALLTEAKITIDNIHLQNNDQQCKAQDAGNWVVVEGNKIVYSNTVYGTVTDTPIPVRRLEIPLTCEMMANETFSFQFNPMVEVTEFPYEMDLSGRLYIEFVVDSKDTSLQVSADSCYSSPTDTKGKDTYTIIKNSLQVSADSCYSSPTDTKGKDTYTIIKNRYVWC